MSDQEPEIINEVDAKGGTRTKGMTTVLVVSTVIAALLLFLIFGVFAV